MKKIVLKDREQFHAWQARAVQGVDDKGQMAVSTMSLPSAYPVMLVWGFTEQVDLDTAIPNQTTDVFDYKYVYISDFPLRNIKHGTYVYQVFQMSEPVYES